MRRLRDAGDAWTLEHYINPELKVDKFNGNIMFGRSRCVGDRTALFTDLFFNAKSSVA